MSRLEAVPETEPEYTFTLVPRTESPYVWARVAPLLKKAVDRSNGRWNMQNVFEAVYMGRQQLWIGYLEPEEIKFAITTEIMEYPNTKILAIHFLGGIDFNEWSDDMLAMLERFAKDYGCRGVEAMARFGFWPLFKRNSYNRSYVIYEMNFLKDEDNE